MWALIGLLAGALAGQVLWHDWGAVLGGLAGFFIGATFARRGQRDAFRKPDSVALPSTGPANASLLARIAALEARVASLERIAAPAHRAESASSDTSLRAAPDAAGEMSAWATPTRIVPPMVAEPSPPRAAAEVAPSRVSAPVPPSDVPAPNPLWAWFTGGNALTRIGVVVLFFGVAFLLRYFAEHFDVTIEMKLSGVAVAGIVLIGLGLRLAAKRPAYGLSLQGAGAGILYLTTYAAFRLYGVLPDQIALLVLIAIAALTIGLALRADSQPLAALAIAGGFLAPVLAGRHGDPLLLFGYFAVLNGVIFALAWFRTWRVLNVLGFVFTFALGFLWGARYYVPAYFATVEPFLVVFVAYYIAIAILETRRAPAATAPSTRNPLDGLLVFGVPLVGFALQTALVSDTRYGAAWSALALAVAYGVAFLTLRRRQEPGQALLAQAFFALAVIFATLAIPFAFEDQWTAGLWAIEAAGVYWMGVRQRAVLARGFAWLVLLAAGAAFLCTGWAWDTEPVFANGHCVAGLLIALSGLAMAFFADRAGEALKPPEAALTPLLLGWGLVWWFGTGGLELAGHYARGTAAHATLAWISVSIIVALVLRHPLAWPRLVWSGAVLLPVMAWIALRDFEMARTTLMIYGYLVFPLAWVTQWLVLHAAESLRPATSSAGGSPKAQPRYFAPAHAISAFALMAYLAWEAGEWVGRFTPAHTAWVACASALPAILYLALVTRLRDAPVWPFAPYGDAYARGAGTPIAALLAVWFVAANVLSPGDASPLAYWPLLNPLEITLGLALVAMVYWARRFSPLSARDLYAWAGTALFVGMNGVVLRCAHHWGDIPWRLSALLASKPLQAALTLTWTVTALALMFIATKQRLRPLWMTGAVLLAIVVGKLFLIDLNALSGLPRVVSFLGVGMLLLVVGYLSPLPPASRD